MRLRRILHLFYGSSGRIKLLSCLIFNASHFPYLPRCALSVVSSKYGVLANKEFPPVLHGLYKQFLMIDPMKLFHVRAATKVISVREWIANPK